MCPLTAKGTKILAAMSKFYGKKRGKQVFYASIADKKVTGAEGTKKKVVKKSNKNKRK